MAETTTQAERLTKLETELESMKVVLLRMEAKMDAWQMNFVSKELLDEKLKTRDEKAKAQDEKIKRLETERTSYKNNLPYWVAVIISTIALIYSFWPKK